MLGDTSSGERNVRAASLLEYGFQQTGWKQLFNSTTLDNMPLATGGDREERAQRRLLVGLQGAQGARRQGKGKKKTVAKATKKKPAATAEKPGPVTVDVAPETTGSAPATVQLRGTMPPPAAASFAPQ